MKLIQFTMLINLFFYALLISYVLANVPNIILLSSISGSPVQPALRS